MATVEFSIGGMSCSHCVQAVNRVLSEANGVQVDSVEIGRAVVSVDPAITAPDDLLRALDAEGYHASLVTT